MVFSIASAGNQEHGFLRQLLYQQLKASIEGKRMFQCINCKSGENENVVDLGCQPIANNLLNNFSDQRPEFPLRVGKCLSCGHYSTGFPIKSDVIFNDSYPYRTGVNEGYLKQCSAWVESVKLPYGSKVLEIGCNDSSLLKIFKELGFRSLYGIDPAGIGESDDWISLSNEFFTTKWADNCIPMDLIIANNVIGHVPDLEDFILGMRKILSSRGKISIEIPDFTRAIKHLQFDTIYHEHYSYFTPLTIQKIFQRHELYMTSMVPIPSHGGSFRYTFEKEDRFPINLNWMELETVDYQQKVEDSLCIYLSDLLCVDRKAKIACFGAAAKGITMLNCLGVKPWLVNFCVDETPEKIGKFLPGSRIPIYGLQSLYNLKPEYLLILPWNHAAEIKEKTKFIAEWGGKHLCLSNPMPNS